MMKMLFLYLSMFLFIFAFLFLFNYVIVSITGQQKQIGILKSIGADINNISKIYLSSSIIIGIIILVSSLICIPLALNIINKYLISYAKVSFNILSINFITYFIITLIIIMANVLGNFLSLKKIKKLSAIKTIEKGNIK